MNKLNIASRHKVVAAAVGSVRAEGLSPSVETQKQLRNYADGKITAKALRSSVSGKFVNHRTK